MKGLSKILLEGRVEDAQQYFEKAVGSWPVAEFQNPAGIGAGTNIEGVLKHFTQNDPSGNNKYLMWMVKMYLNPEERGTSPNDISSVVQRFHKNVDRLNVAFIMNMDIFDPSSRISTSPKNIDSYDDLSQLERVMDELDTKTTKKEKEKEAKSGVDKLYEDDRWLLVRPNTYEGSCYYGSSTKWCTASKDAPQHFASYTKSGNLFYIIDKKRDVGDFFKIALHKKWSGEEMWYDRADNELKQETEEAIKALLPLDLVKSLEAEHSSLAAEAKKPIKVSEFKRKLDVYVNTNKAITYSTPTGKWKLEIVDGVWRWYGVDPRIELIATPFPEGRNGLVVYFQTDDDDLGQPVIEYRKFLPLEDLHTDYLGPGPTYHWNYLSVDDPTDYRVQSIENAFISQIYMPIINKALSQPEVKEYMDVDYTTWDAQSYVSSYTFKYPPKQGSMTQKFVDYLKELHPQKRTANQFYEDVLGRSRPRAHNNMFFASIKDSGIVKMERSGRQFVYSLGPNHEDWAEGKLLRRGRAYGNPG